MTQTTFELPTANGAFRLARIAFIQAGWHSEIVNNAYQGFIGEIGQLGFAESSVDRFETPGVFEIPLHAQTLAKTGRYAAIVAAGFVVNGGIYRHDFVSQTVISGLMQVQLTTEVPVFSVVLTPHHFHEHDEHRAFFREHFLVKGAEAAQACAKTLHSLARLAAAA